MVCAGLAFEYIILLIPASMVGLWPVQISCDIRLSVCIKWVTPGNSSVVISTIIPESITMQCMEVSIQ